jgi:hypothetical protein
MMEIHTLIVNTAYQYLFQSEQGRNNMKFIDKHFQELLEIVGWNPGDAWCALFGELVWKEAYSLADSTVINELDKLFSASAVQTYLNFKNSGIYTVDMNPGKGALAIWQRYIDGKPQWSGHLGIVTTFDTNDKTMVTIDGNTNSKGSADGDIVGFVTRSYVNDSGRLKFRGFVHPKSV